MKTCTICLELKENARFDRSDTSADGHVDQCKACRLERQKFLRQSRAGVDNDKLLRNWKPVDIEWEEN